jgi:hypothetical protein
MSTKIDVTFRDEFLAALQGGAAIDALLDIVRQFKAGGGAQREAYETLQAIWLEFGFDSDEGDEANPLRDKLEYVMEVVWGFCSPGASIWDGTLSNNM